MAALVDLEGLDHKDAAAKWLADNEATWVAWTK
jgi:glycine betaine/proline transport system substrate-binding protein